MARPRWPRALAAATGARLIRLQCHEGIDLHHAVYDWDYARQLLALRAAEGGVDEGELFSRRFLLRRPLLDALEHDGPVVLLIDEIDRADDEFEAFLLEFLSDFAVTIPELGTITRAPAPAGHPDLEPDARAARRAQAALPVPLDRLPEPEREREIVHARIPGVPEAIVLRVVPRRSPGCASSDLYKVPGVGETLVWAQALIALGADADLEGDARRALKVHEDIDRVRETGCWRVSDGAAVVGRRVTRAERCRGDAGRGRAVGLGELLDAHRALAAVDASSREDAGLRCARCCAQRSRTSSASSWRSRPCSARRWPAEDPFEALGKIERAALPRAGVPDAPSPRR